MSLEDRFKKLKFGGLVLFFLLILFFFFTFWAVFSYAKDYFIQSDEAKLEVVFLDVGQGDSVLIRSPYGQNILIDGGPDKAVTGELSKVMPWWDKTIDLMILTHPHSDHVTGLNNVLDRYDVLKVLHTGVTHTSPAFIEWLKKIEKKESEMIIVKEQQNIKLGEDCFLEILHPSKSLVGVEVDNLNNASIVARLVYRDTKFLFTGDAEQEIEQGLLESGLDISADVFKASHHGSKDSNSLEFLKLVDPAYVVFQVGKNNPFHHPSDTVVSRVKKIGAKTYRTDEYGAVRVLSDGFKIRID